MIFLRILKTFKKIKNRIMENSSKIILGLLGAAAAGIAIGMLMAPEKGTELRKKITDKAGSLAGDLSTNVNDLVTYGKNKFEEASNSLTKQADGLVNEATKRADGLMNEGAKRADRVKESIA